MQFADQARRWLVAAMLSGGVLLLAATPAFASHEGTDPDRDPYCHFPDSSMADVEEGPVGEDTSFSGWCHGSADSGPIPSIASRGGGGGGAGDVGADAEDIVPAARIDAGGGGAATAGVHPGQLAGAVTAGLLATAALRARRRR